jgi:hypothetical protein
MANEAKGKGGNFDKRPNPFNNGPRPMGAQISFTDISNIATVLDVTIASGCAIMLGRTRDGGALVLTILDGDDRYRTYCANNTELQNAIDAMLKMYSD